MPLAFIALGSNLEQPRRQVELALAEIASLPQTRLLRQSSLYRTAPLDHNNLHAEAQPEFINAVAGVETELPPLALLHALLAIENSHGRERPYRNAPRVLDLDLLLYDDRIMNTAELTLPHPRMCDRGFVLLPLAEIAPGQAVPGRGNVAELAQHCPEQGVTRIDPQ